MQTRCKGRSRTIVAATTVEVYRSTSVPAIGCRDILKQIILRYSALLFNYYYHCSSHLARSVICRLSQHEPNTASGRGNAIYGAKCKINYWPFRSADDTKANKWRYFQQHAEVSSRCFVRGWSNRSVSIYFFRFMINPKHFRNEYHRHEIKSDAHEKHP